MLFLILVIAVIVIAVSVVVAAGRRSKRMAQMTWDAQWHRGNRLRVIEAQQAVIEAQQARSRNNARLFLFLMAIFGVIWLIAQIVSDRPNEQRQTNGGRTPATTPATALATTPATALATTPATALATTPATAPAKSLATPPAPTIADSDQASVAERTPAYIRCEGKWRDTGKPATEYKKFMQGCVAAEQIAPAMRPKPDFWVSPQ
jgi:hypothetical protein